MCYSSATKLADTFASEIGKAYGKTTFLITTLEKVPPGTEGAISAEGTAADAAAEAEGTSKTGEAAATEKPTEGKETAQTTATTKEEGQGEEQEAETEDTR